ncbi:NDP-sugar epimerase, includes UDP-GlcNAc-inverting 4,6-dehydratase FlaA1 and capsular polysaccharide biosynthesis protein EpsC [Nitrosomonas cryotolerans]|uniref:NDP-sugar epimerase, includes UDP-GlcNAc-inverting 4,6-dehydratase FlaA1 and capsular polysaccharide biosynthesis protein EpsC n=1 Tax=Nitrosomonas cryotolerans ATCC 49181 TaxID=1131553 RepID=A0A1N6I710_9PROT|nr:nucleoside-diphosphate sugar epimerase/dehydratase [Nitrosomonas cryotolerans]SFQ15498.1 NDP-sugar epimerase, includes UDP-GlcNAc-inverting 4,6-dehydratase FlaA1 and capsular polysaccharide biosynthesis protein EpsC [Nitrosomonas cryotolerans]SIO27822.1 NDP-sugar epimerase, includes UDP-GlcNAc-inverting 4,6-dehydratase FlaA1 and capsular polysaccharide biosynthesis protein EpsC [Nitrosomonas cryotolerans ATCC 49181]
MFASKFGIRTFIAFVHDFTAVIAAWWFAYLFCFNFKIPSFYLAPLLEILPWVVPIQAGTFLWFGLYRGLWRYASLPDLKRIFLSVILGTLIVSLVLLVLGFLDGVPRSVIFLAPMLLLLLMGGTRLMYRAWKERRLYSLENYEGKLVLILGTGSTAVSLVKDLARSRDWHVVGMLDDDPRKLGTRLHGIRVLGVIDDLPHWVQKLNVGHVIIAMPSASRRIHRHALEMCSNIGIRAMTVPSYVDLISGKTTISQIRDIELDDLLGRAPVVLDNEGLHGLLTGKTILITGAGGSIGSELCRQIVAFKPGRLVLLELNEFALYSIQEEFQSNFPEINMSFVIGNIKDRARLVQLFEQFHPAVVFHAAAYKHVPLMENDNAWQALSNNVMGTYILARTAIDFDVEKFVLISTDKAVNPISIMGASKRLAEMVCQALQQYVSSAKKNDQNGKTYKTCFVMVRFGNVLGSAGSVIPKFREQIARGGPITVTHPKMTRYFMSIPEAAQLVLQAGLMGGDKGGGEIFVLDMGDPVRIVDLAGDLIRLSGLGEEDIRIVYSGLRPGEKLHEELLAANESTLPTHHAKLRIAQASQIDEQWLTELITWFDQHPVLSDAEVRCELPTWVPEYSYKEMDA